jgi:general secretion pathway protein H
MHSKRSRAATVPGTTSAPLRLRGFTLIEILVVIVIITVIVGAVTISVGVLGGDRQAEDQARRLWAVMQQAREEAELQGLDSGLYLSGEAYEFLRFQPRSNAWQPIPEDPLYIPRTMPSGLRFRTRLDGREVVLKLQLPTRTIIPVRKLGDDGEDDVRKLGEDDKDDERRGLGRGDDDKDEDKDNPPPQIILLANGDISAFEVEIERDGAPALWRVTGTADNDLRVERRDDASRWEIMAQTNPSKEESNSSARK